MSERYCKICEGWHSLEEPWPEACTQRRKSDRADLPAPGIITDTMAPVQSMLDGRMYDSKRALRATYKAAGVVEVGNDPQRNKPFVRPKINRADIVTSIEKAKAKVERGEYTEKTKRKKA